MFDRLAGDLGRLPSSRVLANNRVAEQDSVNMSTGNGDMELDYGYKAGLAGAEGGIKTRSLMVCIEMGLSPIPKRLMDKMRANKYIDFTDLPSVRGKGRTSAHHGDGLIVVVPVVDLL